MNGSDLPELLEPTALRDGSTTADPRCDLIRAPHKVNLRTYDVLELVERDVHERVLEPTDAEQREWLAGPVVLDQGSTGACVGHAIANDAMGEPRFLFRGDPEGAQADAFTLYERAQELDEWPETFAGGAEGTSLQAGAAAAIEQGHFREYRWADSIDAMIAAMLRGRRDGDDVFGPCIVAVQWRHDMYFSSKADPVVRPGGEVVGWHAIWVRKVNLHQPGFGEPIFTWRNSWGPDYGDNGDALVSAYDLGNLLGPEPEIMFPIGRRKAKNVDSPK